MPYYLNVREDGCQCHRVLETRYEKNGKSRVIESYVTFTDCVEEYIAFWTKQYAHTGEMLQVLRHDLVEPRRRKCVGRGAEMKV